MTEIQIDDMAWQEAANFIKKSIGYLILGVAAGAMRVRVVGRFIDVEGG